MSWIKSTFVKKFLYANAFALTGAGLALYGLSKGSFKDTIIEKLLLKRNANDNEVYWDPSNPSDEKQKKPLKELEAEISNVELVREMRNNPNIWKELPMSYGLGHEIKSTSFVHNTLNQPDHLLLEPVMFIDKEKQNVTFIFYIGKKLCGHPGITHGGIQAILYDEAMARPALLNLPRNTGFTAYLNITYKVPVVVNQILIMKCILKELKGRKALVTASIENTDGLVLSTAESLFISPRDPTILADNTATLGSIKH
ncbi:hypothetical protein BB559_002595 [Furculomyces boomerangus]|uniref:Thioesterase domain-containing protein n=2 Tax=Harpellales TaxID=61421 RepID=A0A2T9YU46_9FUNG|nr:hypothetical protein BB559_002595 [Furculomyces boomerangus]PWA01958.1 hypothetical protein BB558_001915 [Smittium angustum]